ncbi:MAG: SufD family Fe-S cluster assembly protein [Alphaproteobacteria bacterium]|nr:SufD family Fe-S cluster assembly protein [Alphaproteobacteria bacterium]
MSYLWEKFNIKTFPAETLVFRNGVFCKDLSDCTNVIYDDKKNIISVIKTPELPIHIIYIGEITGNIDMNIDIKTKNTRVIMSSKITNKNPAFLNIFVKNTGKNSIFDGNIIAQNYNSLEITTKGEHLCENTGIFIKTKVLAHKNSNTILKGFAVINKNMELCDSNISFSFMAADETAKIIMVPTQYIQSIPKNAIHNASIYKSNKEQINYLRMSGLGGTEVKKILEEAFLS